MLTGLQVLLVQKARRVDPWTAALIVELDERGLLEVRLTKLPATMEWGLRRKALEHREWVSANGVGGLAAQAALDEVLSEAELARLSDGSKGYQQSREWTTTLIADRLVASRWVDRVHYFGKAVRYIMVLAVCLAVVTVGYTRIHAAGWPAWSEWVALGLLLAAALAVQAHEGGRLARDPFTHKHGRLLMRWSEVNAVNWVNKRTADPSSVHS